MDASVVALTSLVDKMLKSQSETNQLLREAMTDNRNLTKALIERSKPEPAGQIFDPQAMANQVMNLVRPPADGSSVVRHDPTSEIFNLNDEDFKV